MTSEARATSCVKPTMEDFPAEYRRFCDAHFVPRLQGGDVGLNRELGLGAVPLQAITSWAFSPPKPVRVSRGVWRLAG